MATITAEDHAKSIGFTNPKISHARIQPGAFFRVEGRLKDGTPYVIEYRVVKFDSHTVTLNVNQVIGAESTLQDINIRFPLVPNKPTKIPKLIDRGQPDIYIAFISPNASQIRPTIGQPLTIALGEIRDTVPPPPPKR